MATNELTHWRRLTNPNYIGAEFNYAYNAKP